MFFYSNTIFCFNDSNRHNSAQNAQPQLFYLEDGRNNTFFIQFINNNNKIKCSASQSQSKFRWMLANGTIK